MQAVTTLRSGKEILKDDPKKRKSPASFDQKVSSNASESTEILEKVGDDIGKEPEISEYKPVAPFPQRLRSPKQMVPNEEILDIFREVKINIPLLDAIK